MNAIRLRSSRPGRLTLTALLALALGAGGAGPVAARGKTAIAPPSAPREVKPVAAHAPATPASPAADGERLGHFVRIEGEELSEEGRLQVARALLRHPQGGKRVILEGVVHMGEKPYYQALQKRLAAYDRVLYEFVRPADAGEVVPHFDGASGLSLVGWLSSSLGLVHQMEGLDYDQENFMWADLSTDEFSKLAGMKSVNELTLIGAVVSSTLKNSLFGGGAESAEAQDTSWGFHEDLLKLQGQAQFGTREAKWFLARQLVRAQGLGTQVLDAELRHALEGAREDRALEVMEGVFREIPDAVVGILYGAGHMPSLQDKLIARGFTLEKIEWDEAWKF